MIAAAKRVPWVGPLAEGLLVDGLAAAALGRSDEGGRLLVRAAELAAALQPAARARTARRSRCAERCGQSSSAIRSAARWAPSVSTGAVVDRAADLRGHRGGEHFRRGVGVVQAAPGAVAVQPVAHVEVLLEVVPQRDVAGTAGGSRSVPSSSSARPAPRRGRRPRGGGTGRARTRGLRDRGGRVATPGRCAARPRPPSAAPARAASPAGTRR